MSLPVVSIITPSFNRADIVHETAESIFAQTSPHWEWVIVDDGSNDDSWEILKSYAQKDARVKIFKRDREPKGACTCRNIAVERCTGDYVMFLDTDDVMAPYCVEQRQTIAAQYPDCDFVVFSMLMFKLQPDDMNLLWNIDSDEDDLSRVLRGNPVCQGTGPLWRKSSFEMVGMWSEDLKLWQDIELHIRSLLYPVKYQKRLDLAPDVYLRVSDNSLSRGAYNSVPKLNSRIRVYEYAAQKIVEKNLLNKYRDSLKVMGVDVILSAINGRMYSDVARMLDFGIKNDIFGKAEVDKLKKYQSYFKMKLYKVPFLFDKVAKQVKMIAPAGEITMNKISWKNKY